MSNPEKTIDWQTVKPDVQKVNLKLSLPPELYNQLKFRSGFDLDLMSATVEKALASFLVNADESEASDDQNRQIYTCEDYDKLIEINPNDYKAWYGRGVVLKNLGSYEEAITSLDKALQIKLDYYKAWYARGNALYALDFYEEAIVSYNKAIEFKPDYYKAWYYRGKALDELGSYEEAKASYDKASEFKADDHVARDKLGKMLHELYRHHEQANVRLPEVTVQVDKVSNHDLILRCQAGLRPDRAAFAELLRRYQSQVDRVLYHLAPDWPDRADLAQEVWIRVYRNIIRLQEPSKFRGWLSRIATNLFYDELRKRKRVVSALSLDASPSVEDGEIAGKTPALEEELTTREFYEQLREAIADLPEVFRTTFVLRELEGLSFEEIAEITGVSLGTVKSRIARARSRLQAQLQNYLVDT
jgi:RNA polymerase sigma-70 factor (ECF subfamily)